MNTSIGDIRQIVFDTLRPSLQRPVPLSDATNIVNDLGLDSVAMMDFVMEIENRLDISVPLDRIAEIESLGDLVRTLRELKGVP
ncbi:MAG: acyl carrier protein [Rhodospirillales bacterium]|nr:acyl carrier protein [Rhodospirillales bacterium]